MVLQDKYKAKASKAWKASRGLSTAPKPTTRRPQPPEVDNQAEFPDLKKSDSSDGSSSENDSSEVSQSEDKLAVPSASNNTTRRSTNPKYSRRRLVDNSSKYDEPATEQEEVLSEEEHDLSSITMKLAKVDDDFEQYVKQATDADADDIDYDLANRHKKKESQLLPIDSESSKALEEMRNDRIKAEASWNLKSRLRGDSGRQYIQRYESSRRDVDHLEDNDFFESVGEPKISSPTTTAHGVKSETVAIKRDNQPTNISTIDTMSDQNFLDELI